MMRALAYYGLCVFALLVGGLIGVTVAAGDEPGDQHALLRTRNIFDPTRRPGRATEERRERETPARVEALKLIGTMLHEGRAFGFFDGSSSSFRQVLSPGEALAGMNLVTVTTDGVELEAEDGTLHWLPVGGGMRREGEGAWSLGEVSVRSVRERDAAAAGGSDAPAAGSGSATGGAGSESDDILKRMMERRRREESP